MPLLPRQAQDGSVAESEWTTNRIVVVAASSGAGLLFLILVIMTLYRYRSRKSWFCRLDTTNSREVAAPAAGQGRGDQYAPKTSCHVRRSLSHDWDPAGMFAAPAARKSGKEKSPNSSPRNSPIPRLPTMLAFSHRSPSTLGTSRAVSAVGPRDRGASTKAIHSTKLASPIDRSVLLRNQRGVERNHLLMDRPEEAPQRLSSMKSISSFTSERSLQSAEYRLPPCPMSSSYEAIDLSEGIDFGPVTSLSPPPPVRSPSVRDTAQASAEATDRSPIDTSEWAMTESRAESPSSGKPRQHVDDSLLAAAALAWWEASGTRSSPEHRRRYSQLGERKRIESTFGIPTAMLAATWGRDSVRLSGLVGVAAFNSGLGAAFPSSNPVPTPEALPEALPGRPKLALTNGPAHPSAGPSGMSLTSGGFGALGNWQQPTRHVSEGNYYFNASHGHRRRGADSSIEPDDEREPLPTYTSVTPRGGRRATEPPPDRPEEARASRAQRRPSAKHRYQCPSFYTSRVARKLRAEELADRRQRHSRQLREDSSKAQQSTPKESRSDDYVLQLSHHDKGFNFGFDF